MNPTTFIVVSGLASFALALLPGVALAQAGALTQLPGLDGCISNSGTHGACVVGEGLDGAQGIAATEDGGSIYVVSRVDDAVVVLARDEDTGALTQLPGPAGCISEDGSDGRCTDGVLLGAALGVAASHDGKNVYTTSRDSTAWRPSRATARPAR